MDIHTNFIRDVFGPVTEQAVWVQSLGNAGSDEKSRHVATRDLADIAGFVAKWDRDGRGMYFCVSTIEGNARTKEHASESIGLWADIDFKDISDTPADVDRKLAALRCPPSRVHNSGNGRHCFWLFKEAITLQPDGIDRIEAATKLLCDLVGGDQAVTQIVALMRLPGTHNTKFGQNIEVTVLSDTPVRYELDDLEEWLAEVSPVILRKDRPALVVDNPFLAHAKANGFKPSIDVEKRLAGMAYMGGGDAAIHGTQLAVSASMLRGGAVVEDVVTTLLEATRGAAAGYGERWNWAREETALRRMCADWLKKHPVTADVSEKRVTKAQQPETGIAGSGNGTGQVIALAPKRAAKDRAQGTPFHIILGGAVLGCIRDRGDDILVTAGEVWRYHDGLWFAENHEASWLNGEIEVGAQALDFLSNIKLINETRQWILRQPNVQQYDVPWDDHGRIPTRSGLLEVETLTLEPAHPNHFATWRIECDYNSTATCPWWEIMLDDFFQDRPAQLRADTIATVQEVLGAALLENKPRALTRALILEGPSEAGKTRILDVLAGLFGDRPIATPLDALQGTHGLMEFRRRAPWVLHEAFNASQWHMSSIVKSILTGDPVQINVKNGALTTQRIKAPVFWGTNHPPQFKEATKAIVNRLIVIKCRVVFDPKKLVGAAAGARTRGFSEPSELVLKTEMSGLLNWAITGLKRALARGYIEITAEVAATLARVRLDSNMVAGFLEECADYSCDGMVSVPDFCAAFAVWWTANKGEDRQMPSNETIGRAMAALGDGRLAVERDMRDNARRYYGGVQLNSAGLDYWDSAHSEGLARGKTARISSGRNEVNRIVPEAWSDRNSVANMRRAFGVTVGVTVGGDSSPNDPGRRDSSPIF